MSYEEEENEEYDDELFSEHHHNFRNPDAYAFDDEDEEEALRNAALPPPPPQIPTRVNFQPIVRSDKQVQDSVCYYGQQALITLLYAHVTQGEYVPGLFDREQQKLPVAPIEFRF